MPIITTPPPSPSTPPSPTSSLSRPLLHSSSSSTSTYTYASTTAPSSPPSAQRCKHSIGDPYAPLLHTPNPHSHTTSKPKRPLLNTHSSSFERLLFKILPTTSKSSQPEIKPHRAAAPRMRNRGGDGNGANGKENRDEEMGKEKVAIFELELPPEVSRDRTEIDYLRRIQRENYREGDGGDEFQGGAEGEGEGEGEGEAK